jgi:cation:H+ antiporter
VSLAVALVGSEALVRSLDRLGLRLHLREGLLGLLTALGADAPEISSALLSMQAGAPDLGVGVVLGSNLFNLAALLGLGALAAGHVRVRPVGLALNGGVAVGTTLLVGGLLGGLLLPPVTAALLLALFVPYVALLATPPQRVIGWRLPRQLARLLALATSEIGHEGRVEHAGAALVSPTRVTRPARRIPTFLALALALAIIVVASDGMVQTALRLAVAWHVASGIVGAVVLAALTSLPNAYAAIRLALQHRGSAVVSEAFNSNTINLIVGLSLPALVIGVTPDGAESRTDLLWLLGLTAVTIGLLRRRHGLTRWGGAAIIALYALFVAVTVRG